MRNAQVADDRQVNRETLPFSDPFDGFTVARTSCFFGHLFLSNPLFYPGSADSNPDARQVGPTAFAVGVWR
jgi:hypothetical protein